MSKAKKTAILVVAALLGACCLACVAAALFAFRYQPAVVAAPGHEMQWPTKPDLWGSAVKRYQATLETRTCDYAVLGWSPESVLFYEENCQDSRPRIWAYDPDEDRRARLVAAAPGNLVQEPIPRKSVLEQVRVPSVRPADAEPMVRNLAVRVDGLASPDGRWVGVVVRYVYGPEDVLVLAQE
jgi:hypothetical protein